MPPPVIPAASDRDGQELRSRNLLRPAILLLLREQEGHGYELMGRLAELGVEVPPTTGGLYRTLYAMADDGLLTSYWATPEHGQARRVYAITEPGEQYLERSMPALAGLARTVRAMLSRYRRGS